MRELLTSAKFAEGDLIRLTGFDYSFSTVVPRFDILSPMNKEKTIYTSVGTKKYNIRNPLLVIALLYKRSSKNEIIYAINGFGRLVYLCLYEDTLVAIDSIYAEKW